MNKFWISIFGFLLGIGFWLIIYLIVYLIQLHKEEKQMNKYQESLDRLASINLDIIEDGETKLNQSIYGIHDRANLEMSGDLQTLQELVVKEES